MHLSQVASFFLKYGAIHDPMMRWGLQILPESLVLRLFDRNGQGQSGMFATVSERALNLGKRRVVVDFTDTDNLDPMTVVWCGYGLYHFRQLGIPFSLIKPPPALLTILKQHGLPDPAPVFIDQPDSYSFN